MFEFRQLHHDFRNNDSVSPAGIPMRKQQIAIIALALWLTLVSVFSLLTKQVDFDIFFVLCLIGMFVIVQLMQSYYVQPGYLKYIRYLITAGIVLLGVIVAKKILDILGWEIVLR
jgi:antibiotic biosynthesis monooxygenase (ABM) superfamily enzyme